MGFRRFALFGAVVAVAFTAACTSGTDAHGPTRQAGGPGRAAFGGPAGGPSGSATPGRDGSANGANPYLAAVPKFHAPPRAVPTALPNGPVATVYQRLPVRQPVAFLTIDDGWTQLPEAAALMAAAHIPFTMFLIAPVGAGNPAFFKRLAAEGGVVEDHTITHPDLKGMSYDSQHHEICDAKASLEQTFGTHMALFRPPYGDYDQTTLQAAHDCGLRAAFDWSESVNNGKVNYQTADHRIKPGDIILMHFRPTFVEDVLAALNAIHSSGLTPALLENYVTVSPSSATPEPRPTGVAGER